MTEDISLEDAIKELSEYKDEFAEIKENSKKYNRYEETLNLAMTGFENVQNLDIELGLRYDLWKSL